MVDNDHEIAASMPFYSDCVDHSTPITIYHFFISANLGKQGR